MLYEIKQKWLTQQQHCWTMKKLDDFQYPYNSSIMYTFLICFSEGIRPIIQTIQAKKYQFSLYLGINILDFRFPHNSALMCDSF